MKDLILLIQQGGILMIPLILCSVISLAVIIEKALLLRKKRILVPEIISVINNIKSMTDIPLALSVCDQNNGVFSKIIRICLQNDTNGVKEEMADQGRQEVRILEKGVGILETIAAVAPILGLLGTVIRMIKVFSMISMHGVGEAATLSCGISEALITTAVGLSIGIPALIFYNYYSIKTENLILDIENISNKLLKKINLFNSE